MKATMESPGDAERRWFPRFPFHTRAVLLCDGVQQEGILLDLALSGALFRGESAIYATPADFCHLDILHGAGRGVVRARVRVVHADGDMAGLQFRQLDFGVLQELNRIVEMNLGTPDILKRDLGALLKPPAGRPR
jgi:hypothetical protein